ncbi:hypothetical protein GCM10009785_35100 [Brooklawnia cerclae]|uniref:hypothetical protein n=1 Tax=Brooklawnia cerclae TaxID=349934 RepID=UPI0031E139C9
MSAPPSERALVGRIAANERWAREPDRSAATAPARAAMLAKFEREVDPDGVLTPEERARRAGHAKKAYFTRLALKSARARRRSKELADEAAQADAELAAAGGEVA